MTIGDILNNPVLPFELEDEKMRKLFSYFLHSAPTIDCRSKGNIPTIGMDATWVKFLEEIGIDSSEYHVYASSSISESQLQKYKLNACSTITRRTKQFIACLKGDESVEINCFLRHLRNSIAHNYVYISEGKRKYCIFDDYNNHHNQTARIMLLKTDLEKLKKLLSK